MNQALTTQIVEAEDELRNAMLSANLSSLDRLLAPDLIFTNHLGHMQSKDDDLAAYRSGALKIQELNMSEQQIRPCGEAAVVSVRVQLTGTYAGHPANGDFPVQRRAPGRLWPRMQGRSPERTGPYKTRAITIRSRIEPCFPREIRSWFR